MAIALDPSGRIAGRPRIAGAIPGGILARIRGVAQRVRRRADRRSHPDEYAFLVGRLLDQATLDRAEREARQSGVATHAVLIASGWVSQADYAAALALALGVEAAPWDMIIDGDSAAMHGAEAELGLPAVVRGSARRVLSATSAAPSDLGRRVAMLRSRGPSGGAGAAVDHRRRPRGARLGRSRLRGRAPPAARAADRLGRPAHLDMADRGCGGRGRRDHRRGVRRAGSRHRRIDRTDGAAVPVRDAAAPGGAAADRGQLRRGSARARFRCSAPRRSHAAGLLGAGAVAARGQRAGRAGAVAACARLSGGQARRPADPGDRRYGDAGGAAGASTCRGIFAPSSCRPWRRRPSRRP